MFHPSLRESSRTQSAIAWLLLATTACGSGASAVTSDAPTALPTQDAPTALPTQDAQTTPHDASTQDAPTTPHDASTQDAPVDSTYVSNTPGAAVVDTGSPATPELVLLSSNVLQEPSGNRVFQTWFAEVKNIGTATRCFVQIDASFHAADGTQIAAFNGYADAEPYANQPTHSTDPCLAPGEIGVFWDNGFVAAAAPLASATQLAIQFSHKEFGSTPAPNKPAVDSQITNGLGGFALTGTITGRTSPIYYLFVNFYPKDARGLVFDIMFADHSETLNPGDVFPFTTLGTPTAFSQYRTYVFNFSTGTKPVAALSPAASATAPSAHDRLAAMRQQHRQATRARAALEATARTAR